MMTDQQAGFANRWVFALVIAAALVAAALRFTSLDVRPMHGDEAVHTVKFDSLWHEGRYDYDPHDYHGPTLYYATLPAVWLSGGQSLSAANEATFRIVPAVFGVAVVLLAILFRGGIGRWALVCAAVLTATSPAMVYYSRYYIQEMLLVFFTLAAIAAVWRFVCTRRPVWCLAAGACAGLMHATKETCVIAWAAAAAALIVTSIWHRCSARVAKTNTQMRPVEELPSGAVRKTQTWLIPASLAVAAFVSIACFSVFFTNAAGPVDSLRTYWAYAARGTTNIAHAHPWHYYLGMLLWTHAAPGPVWSEALILGLGAIGLIAALTGRVGSDGHVRFARFWAIYTILMIAIYSAIPYKTPWCMLQFLAPLILLAGTGAVALISAVRSVPARVAVCAVLCVLTADLGRQAHAASNRFASDNRNPYAYAHPVGDVKRLGAWVERLASVHADGDNMLIKVVVDDCWPLPWYLRRLERVGYWEDVPDNPDAAVVIVERALAEDIDARLSGSYRTYHYGLRPGTSLVVYIEDTLWQAFAERERGAVALPGEGKRE